MFRTGCVRAVLDVLLALLVLVMYNFGSKILSTITGIDFWGISIVGGCTACAAIFYLFSRAKDVIWYLLKGSMIWSVCYPKDKGLLVSLRKITCDWKETFSVAAINTVVRRTLRSLADVFNNKEMELPDFLKIFQKYSVVRVGKKVLIRVFDYADECTLAWCYLHDDPLLKECVTGLALFMKNSISIMATLIPMILMSAALRVVVAVGVIVLYTENILLSIKGIVIGYVLAMTVDRILVDSFLEPLTMHAVVQKYTQCADEGDLEVEGVKEKLKEVINLDELLGTVSSIAGGKQTGKGEKSGDKTGNGDSGTSGDA